MNNMYLDSTKYFVFVNVLEKIEPAIELGILESSTEIIIPSIVAPDTTKSFILNFSPPVRLHPIVLRPGINLIPSSKLLLENIEHAFIYKSYLISYRMMDDQDDDDYSFFAKITRYYNNSTSTQNEEKKDNENLQSVTSIPLEVKIFFIEQLIETDETLLKIFPYVNPPTLFIHPKLIENNNNFQYKSFVSIEQIPRNSTTIPSATLNYAPIEITYRTEPSSVYYQ